jgi:hypothetical protein
MVLTKSELQSALDKETKILLHLIGKLEPTMVDYRPTPKQRSTLELLKYLSIMGPGLLQAAKAGGFDRDSWMAADQAAQARNLEQTKEVIAGHPAVYAKILADMSDGDFRAEIPNFDGTMSSKGAFITALVLGGYAAYRTQLFMYLKACGREELGTANLWMGVDPQPAATT